MSQEQVAERGTLGVADLGKMWRVDVEQGWAGLEMRRTFVAQLHVRNDRDRWKRAGAPVMNNRGPSEAVRDLLGLLDSGSLPVVSR